MKFERRSSFGWGPTPAGTAPCRNGIVVHYDGSNLSLASKPHSACRTYWIGTRRFHINTRGWLDIGYSLGLCPHGIVMEGRGVGRVQAAQPGGNSTWTSVTLMSGPNERPTGAQLAAFKELRSWLRGQHGVAAAIKGHRDFISTSCPGTILYGMVRDGSLLGAPPNQPAKPQPKPGTSAPKWPGRIITQPPVMVGEDVRMWQRRMRERGWRITVDGRYGPGSEEVCRAFQREKHLHVDGIVGRDTWRAAWEKPIT